MNKCKKCDDPSSIVLRKKDTYCTNCFLAGTIHKFRACLGKNKILRANENVLTCLSTGIGSITLLDLLHNAVSMDSHKKLRINPIFLHIIDEYDDPESATLIKQCNKYDFNIYICHIAEYMEKESKLPDINVVPHKNEEMEAKFKDLLSSLPSSTRNDFLLKVKRYLYIRYAKMLNCKAVFTAETTTTLAINLLSNLALGRGSQIESDVGFCDSRNETVKIIRPMKEISKEELDYYIKIRNLVAVSTRNSQETSLQSVITSFVADLQESFQATISTVCKTADKIGSNDDVIPQQNCIMCESPLDAQCSKLRALEATKFSQLVSHTRFEDSNIDVSTVEEQNNFNTMFPFIHKHLCYGCCKNYKDLDKSNLPVHLVHLLQQENQ